MPRPQRPQAPQRAGHLAAVASAVPPTAVGPAETIAALRRLFPDEDPAFLTGLVERSGVEQRHLALPLETTLTPGDFTARNRAWREVAQGLAERGAREALARAELAPTEIDCVIDVSCTGISIPALDVALVDALGLRRDVKRVPIAESGCAAGGLALGLAGQLAASGQTSLVVAVELCSLTLVPGDLSRTNLVSAVIFGDGCAAAVVTPEPPVTTKPVPRLVAVGSHLFEDTAHLMGFDVGTHGLRIVLERELPVILDRQLRGVVLEFLARHGRTEADVGLHLVHPGGRRILESYAKRMELASGSLRHSFEALRRYGNLSSASILTVLELAANERVAPGTEALTFALGPGLSAELALWTWPETEG